MVGSFPSRTAQRRMGVSNDRLRDRQIMRSRRTTTGCFSRVLEWFAHRTPANSVQEAGMDAAGPGQEIGR